MEARLAESMLNTWQTQIAGAPNITQVKKNITPLFSLLSLAMILMGSEMTVSRMKEEEKHCADRDGEKHRPTQGDDTTHSRTQMKKEEKKIKNQVPHLCFI